ncbi:MAG: hypothetical protein FJ027_10675 [Candidatus Rokubacteria bacterium]|nr:hypothetical protein [Candidatus Rokubacteria bacterium]
MSTDIDIAHFSALLPALDGVDTVLYVGCRQTKHFAPLRERWPACHIRTLDIDPAFGPDVVWDVCRAEPIPAVADLVVCSGVLSLVENAVGALDRLLDAAGRWLVLQESVLRPRDGVPGVERDLNRFYCDAYAGLLEDAAVDVEGRRRKNMIYVGRPELVSSQYYSNEAPSIAGLWVYRSRGSRPA